MKKFSSAVLVVVTFLYGSVALSPALAVAHNSSDREGENRGRFSISWGKFANFIRNNSNKSSDKHDDDKGKDHDKKGDKKENLRFQIKDIKVVPGAASAVISWKTGTSTQGTVIFGTSSTTLTSSVSESGTTSPSHQVTLTGLTPSTKYFFAIKTQGASSTIVQSNTRSFKTLTTDIPSGDTNSPNILFAVNIGSSASTTSIIWVTNESSNSNVWVSTTTPVATTTAPVATSGTLSFFHQLNIPNLATSTLYYYTVGSADSSGNTSYHSNSFTTPSI